MEETLEDLKQEATELGIEFSDRIGAKTLKERIEAFYDEQSKGATGAEVSGNIDDTPKTRETPTTEKEKVIDFKSMSIDEIKEALADNPSYMHQVITKKIDLEAREPVVVRIAMVDKREASSATDAYFNNGAFAMRVPLDQFVEMPKALVELAESMQVLAHNKDSNGNSIAKYVKKYVVEYKR